MKVVIWGHKYNNHTHGNIHSSYLKAFQHLGYDAMWLDDLDDVSGISFNDCLFFTEGNSQERIPLIKGSKYVLHHVDTYKYINAGVEFIELANYLQKCDTGDSPYYKDSIVEVVSQEELCFWDQKNKTIYQPWGTNLLPHEIEPRVLPKSTTSDIFYFGTAHDNQLEIRKFSNIAFCNGYNFRVVRGTDDENRRYAEQSLMSVDLRGEWHVECGYLPCRVFKNISYGRITGTNSPNVAQKLRGTVFSSDMSELFDMLMRPTDGVVEAMECVKKNHTFINRCNNLLKFI